MYESLIKCIFIYEDYTKMKENDFYDFLDSIKKMINDAKQIYLKLYLPSKEMYSLQILINIFTAYDSCKKKKSINDIRTIFSEIIKNMTAENIYIIAKDYEGVKNEYNELIIVLDKIFDKELNEKEYSLLLNDLFLSRYIHIRFGPATNETRLNEQLRLHISNTRFHFDNTYF